MLAGPAGILLLHPPVLPHFHASIPQRNNRTTTSVIVSLVTTFLHLSRKIVGYPQPPPPLQLVPQAPVDSFQQMCSAAWANSKINVGCPVVNQRVYLSPCLAPQESHIIGHWPQLTIISAAVVGAASQVLVVLFVQPLILCKISRPKP